MAVGDHHRVLAGDGGLEQHKLHIGPVVAAGRERVDDRQPGARFDQLDGGIRDLGLDVHAALHPVDEEQAVQLGAGLQHCGQRHQRLVNKIDRGQAVLARQLVAGRHRHHQLADHQGLQPLEARVVGREHHKADIAALGLHHVQGGRRGLHVQGHQGLGELGAELGNGAGQKGRGHGRRSRHLQPLQAPKTHVLGDVSDALYAHQRLVHVFEQQGRGRRRLQPAFDPLEQRHTDARFEFGDQPRDHRLGHLQRLGGRRDRAAQHQRPKRLQVPQCDLLIHVVKT